MNINEYAAGGGAEKIVHRGAVIASNRKKRISSINGLFSIFPLKWTRVKDLAILSGAILLLVLWILNFDALDLVTISFGNSPGGPGVGFQGLGDVFNLLP